MYTGSRHGKVVRVLGGMTPDPPDYARRILYEYAHLNLGDPESYPELLEAWSWVVGFTSRASLGRDYHGLVTSGGTESNILAAYASRLRGARRILFFETAHYSVAKAAALLGLEAVRLPVLNGYEPDLGALEKAVWEDSLVVATLGNTFTGYLDPVQEIARIAGKAGASIHVDAAFAGIIARSLGVEIRLDKTIRTFSTDLHKIPEAPIGVGVLLTYDEDTLRNLWFKAPYIPSGRQPGLLGTRPGAPLLAAKALLERMGVEGLKRLGHELMKTTRAIYEELVEKGPYKAPHEPQTPIICLIPPNLGKVLARLERMGYKAYTCRPLFEGIRLVVMPHILQEVDKLVKILREAVG
ncbi:MAG: aminotransferase class V-fold PLP-dependent enzyme [Pyrodictiaceae archaeon]